MTDITAGHFKHVPKVIVHPLTVRVTHWLNAVAMVIMIMSGWRIYNSDPIFPFSFPIALTLGGTVEGSVDIHNEDGLAGHLCRYSSLRDVQSFPSTKWEVTLA